MLHNARSRKIIISLLSFALLLISIYSIKPALRILADENDIATAPAVPAFTEDKVVIKPGKKAVLSIENAEGYKITWTSKTPM